jgi:5-methylcytosine-specific restriction endonuclease McrA
MADRLSRPCLKCGLATKGELGGGIPGPDGRPVFATGRGGSYCAEHQPARKRKHSPYNYAWRKASENARRLQPWCTRCGSVEDLTADHVVPLNRGGELVPEASWIIVLCRSCNSAKKDRV